MSARLERLLKDARKVRMTPEEREAQRISFAYGNTKLANPRITRAIVVAAARLEAYRKRRYAYTIIPCKEGGFFAEVKDLPGCITQAETWQELHEMIEDAKSAWIEAALLSGRPIPSPSIPA